MILNECEGAKNKLNSIPHNKSKGFFTFKMLEFTIGGISDSGST